MPQEIETGEPLNAVHSVTDDTETSRTPGRRSAARAAKTKAATPSNTKAEGSRRTKKRRISREPEEESDESGSEWEVEKIVDSQIDADTHEHFYEVKWKGYPSEDNTWELKKDLVHCREAIADYEKQKKKRK